MPYGFNGKILRVDLSSRAIEVEEPGDAFYRTYFGGTNVIAYYLLKETRPGIDPLGPENKLVFSCGPVTGAPLGGAGRNGVGAKSPLTGGFGDSQAGGFFGAELKRAGYDGVVFEGAAEKPVYLSILDGVAELRDASHLWGKNTLETETAIRDEIGDRTLRFATIGPAGENLVRYASILNDVTHAAGRTGMGAVMGSKKLKAVAVRGKAAPAMAEPEKVKELAKYMVEFWKNGAWGFHDVGTAGTVRALQMVGGLPSYNFRQGHFDQWEPIDGVAMRDTILAKRGTCFACPVHCKREVRVGEPWNVEPVWGGPEYETLGAFGSLCGVGDLGAICKANEICNAYGFDTISAGVAIAFAMECFEAGLLKEKDTGGLRLAFGNAEAMVKLTEMIARREGLGRLLGEGVKSAAAAIGGGAEQYAMHIKGLELPMHEPRLKQGLGIGYAVSPTGADHVHNIHDTAYTKTGTLDFGRLNAAGILEPLPASDLSAKKVRLFYYEVTRRWLTNALVTCVFLPWNQEKITEAVNAITGWNATYLELHNVGERTQTMPRLYNLREGFTAADDSMPARLFEAFTSGPLAGVGVDRQKHRQAVELYYQMMGWDSAGLPTSARLVELNLEWAAGQGA